MRHARAPQSVRCRKPSALSDDGDDEAMPLPTDIKVIYLGGIFLILLLAPLYAVAEIVRPLLFAFILSLLLKPLLRLLVRLHIPRVLSAILLVAAVLCPWRPTRQLPATRAVARHLVVLDRLGCGNKRHEAAYYLKGFAPLVSPYFTGTLPRPELLAHWRNRRPSMRTLVLAVAAAAVAISVPLASSVRAEDTTVIKKDRDGDTTVIKKKQELHVLPVPHTEEKKTIIRKDHDEE